MTTTTSAARRRVLPAWAALLALLSTLLSAAPASAASAAGTTVTLTGVVRTLAVDVVPEAEDGARSSAAQEDVLQKVLIVGDRTYDLAGLAVDSDIVARIVGRLVDSRLEVLSVSALGDAIAAPQTRGVAGVASVPTTGTTRVLTMLAYWTEPDSVTPARAASVMYSDGNAWFRDASYSTLGQVGDVTPWLKIDGPAGGCYADRHQIMSQAQAAAAAVGFDPAAYDNVVVYFPNCGGDAAGYAGWGYVGATGTWLNGYMNRRVSVHEQGHNYGLWHSHSYICDQGGLSGDCYLSDYGDPYDAMGNSNYVGHFNASQKSLLGWLDGRTVDLSSGGSATLVPMADDGMGTHAAVMRRENGTSYWVEYRQPVDFDSGLPVEATDGVLIHVSGPDSGSPDTGASLIDPLTSDGNSAYESSLSAGESWRSPDGVLLRVGAVTAEGATVTVSTAPSPALQVTPSQLDFPTTTVGTRSAAQVVTLRNTGNAPLPLTSIATTGPDAAAFVRGTTSCGTTLAVAASCTVPIQYAPTVDDYDSAQLTIVDGAAGSPHIVELYGYSVPGLQTSMPTPVVSGSAVVGQTLTANAGTWDPGVTLAYQWKRKGGAYIAGATGPSYTLTASDLGTTVSVSVTGTKPGYYPATKSSASTATVTNATAITGPTPTVTGSAVVGGTLTAVPGSWSPAPVALAYQWRRGGAAITGATASTYSPVAADSGAAITVTVTGTKTGFTAVSKSSAAVTVAAGPLTLTPTPTISGATSVGSTLTARAGTWDSGVSLTYQWKRSNGVSISGATSSTYVLTSADVGATVTVSVTGTKPGYSPATRTSAATAVVTAGSTAITGPVPTITGTATVGQTLTAVAGTWSPAPVALAYQWRRGGTAISGATGSTYRLVAADVNAQITVSVTGSKTGSTSVTRVSTAMTIAPALQTLMPTPTITGTRTVGQTLTAVPGTWDTGVTLSYQWKRNGGVYINGATKATYVLTDRDLGATLTVSVTGTKPGYSPATKTSATTSTVAAGTLTVATPTITGTAKVGQTLTAVPGTWGPGTVSYTYQWKRGGVAVSGATAATYKPVSADAGKVLTVTVTGTKPGFTTASKTSGGRTVAK
ncbi:hypothetical protein SAMN06295885_3133 [Rathayibacter oskolensis]|uniref:HYDIN/VesB/CFA65-like Ig-like domain-containing protein n=1 Tax=Rathayibacter oskolensis TaxID=1891671 RepID=A0A1X7PEL6_9MICO|nr:choice-of-anchor D domain-containing protein [Rathayibacter oskolensis]SMH48829.1 hypothetical protein SAMN06295885_3133 [Rathayibacter oskolensis]